MLFCLFFASLSLALKSHGESCVKRKDCDASSGLTCLKNVCQCSRPDSTAYSDSVKACLIKIGRRCDEVSGKNERTNDTELNGADLYESGSTTQSSSVFGMTCVENAECRKLRSRHWCQCKDGYAANGDGTECRAMSKYGMTPRLDNVLS